MIKKVKDVKVNLDLFIDFFAFISMLIIGADIWGVKIGINLRISQIFLCVFTLLLFLKKDIYIVKNKYLWLFVLVTGFSTVCAFNVGRAVLFYFSIIYNTIFIYLAFYNYVRIYGINKLIKIFRATCYVQFFIMMMQVALKMVFNFEFSFLPGYGQHLGVYRFALWFYEPSYLATYVSFWFTTALTMWLIGKDKTYIIDAVLCLGMFVFSTSSSGFIAIIAAFILVYIVWLTKGISITKILILLLPIALFVGLMIFLPSMYELFFARIFSGDLNGASGGRINAWAETFNVFKENFLFGVGPGCYGIYLNKGFEHVPSNVTLDLMATVGILGAIFFYMITLRLIVGLIKIYRKTKCKNAVLYLALALSLIIFTVILQVNQGYLRIYHWMFFGILEGALFTAKKEIKTLKENSINDRLYK